MKSKLGYLTGISLKRKIMTKWFFAANVLIALVLVAGFNIDTIIKTFGGDFDEKTQIYVIDHTNESYEIFKSAIDNATLSFNIEDKKQVENKKVESDFVVKKYQKSEEEAKKLIEKEKKTIVLVLDEANNEAILSAKLISKDYLNMTNFQIINSAVNTTKSAIALERSDISKEELAKISAPIKLEREYLDAKKNANAENSEMIMGFVFPLIILPFFMLTIFLVQMIGAEVNDEKTTRGMEIIISNVSPTTHFFSKVIAGNLFVLIQGGLLFLYAGIGLFMKNFIGGNIHNGFTNQMGSMIDEVLKSGLGDKLIYIIPLTLILMILTFVAYSLLAGVLASMTTTIEDFQQLQTPIMVISMVGYFLAVMSSGFTGSLFIKIFSYIPFISAILSPSLLMMGEIGITDIIVSIVLVSITIFILVKYGLKIYKVGILNYSSKDLWGKMFKALKD